MTNHEETEKNYILKLFVTGMSLGSVRAIENIKEICEEFLKDRYDLEIIDIHLNPNSMYENDIIASPTLIKSSPAPRKKTDRRSFEPQKSADPAIY